MIYLKFEKTDYTNILRPKCEVWYMKFADRDEAEQQYLFKNEFCICAPDTYLHHIDEHNFILSWLYTDRPDGFIDPNYKSSGNEELDDIRALFNVDELEDIMRSIKGQFPNGRRKRRKK